MSLQNILGESNGMIRRQMEETKGLVNKWEKTGLLEGLDKEYDRHGTAILLENQAKQLISEASVTAGADNAEQWAGVALPLVRRIFAEIAAKEFVSVQPMNLPSGLVFYLDFKYGTGVKPFTSGGSLYGANASTNVTDIASSSLYGAGKFGYSINQFSASSITIVSSSATWADFNFDSDFSASAASNQ